MLTYMELCTFSKIAVHLFWPIRFFFNLTNWLKYILTISRAHSQKFLYSNHFHFSYDFQPKKCAPFSEEMKDGHLILSKRILHSKQMLYIIWEKEGYSLIECSGERMSPQGLRTWVMSVSIESDWDILTPSCIFVTMDDCANYWLLEITIKVIDC